MAKRKILKLDLDELYTSGYFYTSFDIAGEAHAIFIEAKNKEAFLDEFADTVSRDFRQKAAEMLEEWEDWES